MKFIKNNVMLLVISFLLTVLGGIGVYFMTQGSEREGRLRTVEVSKAAIEEQIKALDVQMTHCIRSLEQKIEASEKHLSEKMDIQYTMLKELFQGAK